MAHKQVIIIRKDLNMRKGKMVSQGSHSSVKSVIDPGFVSDVNGVKCLCIPLDARNEPWLMSNFKKICVSVNSEHELLELYLKAKNIGLYCSLIQDSGLTEFGGNPTYTAVAIGPDDETIIDAITGGLPLL